MRNIPLIVSLASLSLLPTSLSQAETLSLEWGKVFVTDTAPENVYFRARYLDQAGKSHLLQVWRQADLHLRRKTDDRLDLYLDKDASGNYDYRLVDYSRQVVISTDRANLYRMGILSDWFGLAHVLNSPRGNFTITPRQQAQTGADGKCIWYQLDIASPESSSRICWSNQWGLPLAIQARTNGGQWMTKFAIEEVRSIRPASGTFDVPGDGFLQIDAKPDDNAPD
ncbi:MAG TPA: hypothetical protein VEG37_06725 [Burkholderiales bacterium]|nr:hypothetical protein [Burkholderiales bacterium]